MELLNPALITLLSETDFLSGYAILLVLQQSREQAPEAKIPMLREAAAILCRRANNLLPPAEETATEIGVTFEATQISPQGRKYLWPALDLATEDAAKLAENSAGLPQDAPIDTETKQKPSRPRKMKLGAKQAHCLYCDKLFPAARSNQKFCGPDCRNKFHNDGRYKKSYAERDCDYCHKPFVPRRHDQRYCRPSCNAASWRAAHRDKQDQEIQRPASQDLLEQAIIAEPAEEFSDFSGDAEPAAEEPEEIEPIEESESVKETVPDIEISLKPAAVEPSPAAIPALRSKSPAPGKTLQPLLRSKDYLAQQTSKETVVEIEPEREKIASVSKPTKSSNPTMATYHCDNEECGRVFRAPSGDPGPHLCCLKCSKKYLQSRKPKPGGSFNLFQKHRSSGSHER